jgi:hypothetical protein
MWYIEDLRAIARPIPVFLENTDPALGRQLINAEFFGKCSKDTPPTVATRYSQVFVLQDGNLKCLGEYLEEGWVVKG